MKRFWLQLSINARAATFLDDIDFAQNPSISNAKNIVQAYMSELITGSFGKFDSLPQSLKTWFIEKVLFVLADKTLTAKAKEFTSLDINKIKDLWDKDLRKLVSEGFVTDIIPQIIEEKISGMQNSLLVVFFVLMLVPFAETAVSNLSYFFRTFKNYLAEKAKKIENS
ncbi:MAG: hypothetical protein LBS39_05000 [Campylobacteraceae bacterium]|jgi:hypothetical protein|nr:hypothetical protein [Campylobacteraceae bacterium]